uniref:Uncharacterized protein n=2 Tax=Archaea TaxID=2157 RepID=D6PBN7_9ARCH|nr:hypothetical protein [uncultured archaeon MedDCM-OCT-S05-C57]
MHSVTLIAQPRSKTPFAKVGAMKSGKYEPKNSGTFGVMWFTDFGDKFWEACRGVDDTPKLRLRDSGFDEMDWSVSFRFAGFKARITSVKYKGFFGKPGNSYMELKIGTQNPNDLRVFLQAFVEKFETPPWIMNNWKKAEAKCGFSKEEIISEWSKGMGREITEEETVVKGWGASLFGSKDKDSKKEEFEIFEDAEGNDVKMVIHGALEVEGDEYAIMSYADDVITTEYEIMKINRDKKGNVTYSGVEDEELYNDLSEAATEHLETKFIFKLIDFNLVTTTNLIFATLVAKALISWVTIQIIRKGKKNVNGT